MTLPAPWLYSVTYGIAITLAGMLAFNRLRRGPWPVAWVTQGLATTIVGGILGAVGFWAAMVWLWAHLGDRHGLPGGSTFLGALLGGTLAGLGFCRFRRVSPGLAFDLGVVPIPLGQAIGRLGCFAAGCCHGRPTGSSIGLLLPDEAGVWLPRYPTQLVASAADLAVFALLLALERRARSSGRGLPFAGCLTLLWIALYAAKRFTLEFLRDEPRLLGDLSWAHFVSAIVFLAASSLLAARLLAARARRG